MHKIQLIFICATLFIAFSTIDGCSAPNKGKLFAPFISVYTHIYICIYVYLCLQLMNVAKLLLLFFAFVGALFIRGLIADVRICTSMHSY